MSGLKVLVGVDKSPESHIALRYVCHLLEHFDAEVEAIYAKPDVDMIRLQQFDVPFLKPKDPGKPSSGKPRRFGARSWTPARCVWPARCPVSPRSWWESPPR